MQGSADRVVGIALQASLTAGSELISGLGLLLKCVRQSADQAERISRAGSGSLEISEFGKRVRNALAGLWHSDGKR